MAFPVHDIIVVCRPEQVREAAVVLSCCPSDRFTPLVIVERPPITEEEYRQRYAAYVEVRNRRDAKVGAALARQEAAKHREEVSTDNAEVDRKAETLTSYRSWWRHQRLVAGLLEKLPLRRAVFLFEPQPNELMLINALPMSRISDERLPTIPKNIERLYLLPMSAEPATAAADYHVYHSLGDLTDLAWHACGRFGKAPEETVGLPEDDPRAYFAGLHRALERGVPIRACNGPMPDRLAVDEDKRDLPSPTEAVLIEVSDDATKLLGVQYAHHRRAKLVLYPEPDARTIEASLAALEEQQHEIVKAKPSAASAKVLGTLREYLFGDPVMSEGMQRIERAVSAVVPDDVVAQVGNLDLTAFTSSVPYNFVKKNGTDWSRKAIGHIAGDASLLVLTEMCRTSASSVGFSLIFDPGFFQTSESMDVFSVLKKRLSYPLVLPREAASSLTLTQLGPSMPLDFLFFNTHGSDNAIVLSDMVLPAFKLVQRVTLASQPFVFNSSCLSWVGVGREFIRVGARGYIGTLWSVDAEMAARYARTVLARVTIEGQPVSRAMRGTGLDRATEHAYIFVGTSNARLEESASTEADAERKRIVFAIGSLLEETASILETTEGNSTLAFLTSLGDLLLQESEKLLAEHDQRWPAPHLDRVDLSILHFLVLSYVVERRGDEIERRVRLFHEAAHMLQRLALDLSTYRLRFAQLTRYVGHIHLRLGHPERAIELLSRSVEAAEHTKDSAAPQLLELSDALKMVGQIQQALDKAKKADIVYAAETPPSRGRLSSLGRLAQLSNALGERDEALRYAREGFELATRLDHLGERTEFKGDEANILLKLRRFDEALVTGEASLDLARQAHDDRRELAAYGVIAEALIGKSDLKKALEYATKGLNMARTRGFQLDIGDFLLDMADIKSRTGDSTGAFNCSLESASLYAGIGHALKVRVALDRATDEYKALIKQDEGANSWEALSRMLKVEIALVNKVDADLRRAITTQVIYSVKDLILKVGIMTIRDGLQALAHDTSALVLKQQGQTSDQIVFIAQALAMFDALGTGRFLEARRTAENLDQLSAGGFQLVPFVDAHAAGKGRGGREEG